VGANDIEELGNTVGANDIEELGEFDRSCSFMELIKLVSVVCGGRTLGLTVDSEGDSDSNKDGICVLTKGTGPFAEDSDMSEAFTVGLKVDTEGVNDTVIGLLEGTSDIGVNKVGAGVLVVESGVGRTNVFCWLHSKSSGGLSDNSQTRFFIQAYTELILV